MNDQPASAIIAAYFDFIRNRGFPCVAAKAALSENRIKALVAEHLACTNDDAVILQFLYDFVEVYRSSTELYHSAVIIFKGPGNCGEEMFESMLWQRLQAISDLDAKRHSWDRRVASAASSPDFSFSIREEAFYVIGLHLNSNRKARQFQYPALVFNPHEQFERLRASNKYIPMKQTVRKRDMEFSGSVNPMLADFGESSEVFQYSGVQHDSTWKCPFVAKHENSKRHSGS
ncbi:MAG TPA: guanitoxin biosynthesis heme-dependent pre-guanitoxin N-hydroxylase GntA [Chryseosolibacter sp.]|nr:guanitoxin biosynthesis heme-dependent pre-guanitoxin N-hydroxylase GntA [Chryseosolibacter sp.]